MREIEAKAPAMESQRRDYQAALDAYEKLSQKLESALAQEASLKAAKDEAEKQVC